MRQWLVTLAGLENRYRPTLRILGSWRILQHKLSQWKPPCEPLRQSWTDDRTSPTQSDNSRREPPMNHSSFASAAVVAPEN